MALSDITQDRYDESGNRYWRLKSDPSMKYNDINDRIVEWYIKSKTSGTTCPLDGRTCDYRMVIPADPTEGYHKRWCRHNHNLKSSTTPPCGKEDFERKKKPAKSKIKRTTKKSKTSKKKK